jgi:single-strand DNA-binding protein
MPSFNRITLVGNLTRDPELRNTPSGAVVCKFTLAVNYRSKEKEEVTFVDCVAWDKTAENVAEYLRKGSSCLVDGRLVIRSYENKEKEKRKATEVIVSVVQFLDSKTTNEEEEEENPAEKTPTNQKSSIKKRR